MENAEGRRKPLLVLLTLIVLLFASCRYGTNTSSPVMSKQNNQAPSLVGRWRQIAPATDEEITMVFTNDGKLIYSIDTPEKTQIINLVYEVSGDEIVTDQPSRPRKEITKFSFEPGGVLVLEHDGDIARFTREP